MNHNKIDFHCHSGLRTLLKEQHSNKISPWNNVDVKLPGKSIAHPPKLNTRVLYGTDYYVVASDEEFEKTIHDLDFTLLEWEQLAYQNVYHTYLDGRV